MDSNISQRCWTWIAILVFFWGNQCFQHGCDPRRFHFHYTQIKKLLDRMIFTDFSVNSQQIFMKFCKCYFCKTILTALNKSADAIDHADIPAVKNLGQSSKHPKGTSTPPKA